jgi:hypothetical protein
MQDESKHLIRLQIGQVYSVMDILEKLEENNNKKA